MRPGSRPRTLASALLCALAMALACGGEAAPEPSAETTAPPIATPLVQVAGCSEVDPDGTCRLASKPATLRLWVDVHGGSALEVSAGDTVLEAKTRIVDGGLALEVEVPAEAERVRVRGLDPPWVEAYAIGIRRWDPPESTAGMSSADPGTVIEALEAELPKLRGEAWLVAMDGLRMAHHRAGNHDVAARVITDMMDSAEVPHARLTRARAAAAAVYVFAYARQDAGAAQPFLDRLDQLARGLPEAEMWAVFSHALLARQLGDVSRARDAFADAERRADRLGWVDTQLKAMEGLAVTLAEVADETAALECLQRMLELLRTSPIKCPGRAEALNNVGWVQLLLSQAGLRHGDATEVLEQVLDAVDEYGECPDPVTAAHARVNLALVELTTGDAGMALAHVDSLIDVDERVAPWVEEVRALAGLRLERWDLVPSPFPTNEPQGALGLRWNTLMREAATWEQVGAPEGAIDAYTHAEKLVDEAVDGIGVDVGRELFLAGKQASARALVDALIRVGRPEEALCRVRLARGRALRRLDRTARLAAASEDARARWTSEVIAIARVRTELERERGDDLEFSEAVREHRRARRASMEQEARRAFDEAYAALGTVASATDCSSLPTLPEGEVMLAVFPLPEDWAVFVADAHGTSARRVPTPPESPTASWVATALLPEAERIESATRIRVLATGNSAEVRWHALPWKGGVLLDVAPVVYALDVTARPESDGVPSRAVVVADPSEDLPLARAEADTVATTLIAAGWPVDELRGQAARRSDVTAALAHASLFHYAGHGEHGGSAGWQGALRLHDGQSFGVADVLTLPHGPAAVVLSGCETGRVSDGTLEGGMSLGSAFVLAGARWVIVTDARVADDVSRAVGEAMYVGAGRPAFDGAGALRKAQLELRARDPTDAWATFRALVP